MYQIHRIDSVSSTNDLASEMARNGAPEGTVVIAKEQTSGRGRHGRTWLSPEGGLYLSVILRPETPSNQVWQIGFVASLSSAEAITKLTNIPANVKWPNDVLIHGRKICGILIEAANRTSNIQQVIVGIGINVEARPLSDEIADKATSICAESGRNLTAFDIEETLLQILSRRYEEYLTTGFLPILNVWNLLDCTAGREIEAHTPTRTIRGTALKVDSDGNLLVDADGEIIKITVGDVLLPNC